jgi:hypothetical protein
MRNILNCNIKIMAKLKKLYFLGKVEVEVSYWTAYDDRVGNCCPSGRARIYVSENFDTERLHNWKRFRRSNGTSKIYDISMR